jgi:hypothetical protein
MRWATLVYMNTTYPSDLTEPEWECMLRFLHESHRRCRTRRHSLRGVFNAIFYVLHTGSPWRYLPSNFPRLSDHLLSLSAVLSQGHLGPPPARPASGGTLPSGQRSSPERSNYGCPVGQDGRGIGPHQWIRRTQARQWPRSAICATDTLGIPMSYYVTPANMHDTQGARRLLAGPKYAGSEAQDDLGRPSVPAGKNWRTGAKHRVDGTLRSLGTHRAVTNQASRRRGRLWNAHLAGSVETAA